MSTISLFIHLKSAQRAIETSNRGKMRDPTQSEMIVLLNGQETILSEFTQTWPVKTGLSKAGWTVQLKTTGDLGYHVFNDVDYTSWVFRAKEGPNPLWPKLYSTVRDVIVPPISDEIIELVGLEQSQRATEQREQDQTDNLIDWARARPYIKAVKRIPVPGLSGWAAKRLQDRYTSRPRTRRGDA